MIDLQTDISTFFRLPIPVSFTAPARVEATHVSSREGGNGRTLICVCVQVVDPF